MEEEEQRIALYVSHVREDYIYSAMTKAIWDRRGKSLIRKIADYAALNFLHKYASHQRVQETLAS